MSELRGRDFLKLQDYAPEEIWQILKTSKELKRKQSIGEPHRLLEGKSLAMIFQKPSTRTSIE
jgi:ornithine carbamoyltransferase